jgi:MFS family permease
MIGSEGQVVMPLRRNGDFLRIWAAQAISVLGTEITLLAFPVIAVGIGASPFEIALLSVAALIPFLVLGLPAGVIVERRHRRPVMISADLVRAAALSTVPLAGLLGTLTVAHLLIVGLIGGTARLFFDVADTSFLPRIVNRSQLVEANSKLYLTLSAGQIAGPGVAGILIAALSAPLTIVVDVGSYLWSALILSTVRRQEPPPNSVGRAAWLPELGEGVRHVFGHSLLRPSTVVAGIYNAAEGGIRALIVAFMITDLQLSPAVAGLTIAAGALGFPFGSLVADRLNRRYGIGRTSFWAAVAGTTGPVLLPLAPVGGGAVIVLVIASFVTALGPSIYGINYVSVRQAVTPDRLQARMNATTRVVIWGAMPLGALAAGVIAEFLGFRFGLAAMAVLGLTCLPVLWFSDFRRLSVVPEPVATPLVATNRSQT